MSGSGGPRVLVVEDDEDTLENLVDVLELDEYEVVTAQSAAEALDRDDWSDYLAAVLDWRLPDASGETVLPRLRELAPELAIVVSTGVGGLEEAVTAVRHGAADYISKPVDPDLLRASLRRIGERRTAQQELRLLQTAVNELAEGIVITDADLEWPGPRIVYANRAMTDMTGYEAEEMLGKTPRTFQGAETDRSELARLKAELAAGRTYTGENRNYRKDGSVFDVELHITPVRNARGRVVSYVSTHRDVTERKRTAERLLHTERLAAMGKAMAGLAHESRNALQRCHANLEMLASRLRESPDELRLVHRLQRAADDLHQLYEEVRSYAAPLQLQRALCDVRELACEAWEDVAGSGSGNVRLVERQAPETIVCSVDRFQLRQALRNVFENAVAAGGGDSTVTVGYADTQFDGIPAVAITIRDEGPGIAAEDAERVFEEFFTTKSRGTGLGLPIVKRIVEKHGGRVAIGSASGGGTEFVMTIPRRET